MMETIKNNSCYGIDFELGESIEADAESVRHAMLAEANNLLTDPLTSMREGICNERLAARLYYYADYLKFK